MSSINAKADLDLERPVRPELHPDRRLLAHRRRRHLLRRLRWRRPAQRARGAAELRLDDPGPAGPPGDARLDPGRAPGPPSLPLADAADQDGADARRAAPPAQAAGASGAAAPAHR